MSTGKDLHSQAINLAEDAFLRQRRGDGDEARRLFALAMDLEKQAAASLEISAENEPSRSVLFRSAASLAYHAGDYDAAERLVAHGLAGYPPEEIAEELRDLFDEITFSRHLTLKGEELSESEWKMTLIGAAVAKGVVLADELLSRADKVGTLVRRTVERKLNLPFRPNRAFPSDRRDKFDLYIRTLLPSSFAVVFQLGKPMKQMGFLQDELEPQQVVDEILECLERVQFGEVDQLKKIIPDSDYYENFVGLAKEIAPDGKDVKRVGFTVVRGGLEKPVAINISRRDIRRKFTTADEGGRDEESETVELEGILTYADTPTKGRWGRVKLRRDGEKKPELIRVPIALMKDVVQPYYDERVRVTLKLTGGKYYWNDVEKLTSTDND